MERELGAQKAFQRKPRRLARSVYYIHRWIGVGATALLVGTCITGILLNHLSWPIGLCS